MQRELSSLPLPPVHRMKLHDAGFTTVQDVIEAKPSALSKELNVSKEEALDIIKLVKEETHRATKPSARSNHQTALEMLHDEQSQQCIITFSEQLDAMLGGGVPLTKITEFCGAPGVGKTQICMQLAVDVHIPESMGGVQGEAVYIDTEGSFIIDRVVDIATATVSHCQQISSQTTETDAEGSSNGLTLEMVLGGIHYIRCHDYVELLASVHLLPDLVKKHPKIKLVIVDSIAFHFRHDFDDFALRTRLLNGISQKLIKLATLNKLAVVLTNQMTTKVSGDPSSRQQSHLVPALGESWGHASTIRVVMHWQGNQRCALLYKSPSKRETTVPYQITTAGIRDVQLTSTEVPPSGEESTDTTQASWEDNPRKRQRLEPGNS